MVMKSNLNNNPETKTRKNDFPENQVGFPERNDATNPNAERERVHVDLETMDTSRKSAKELDKETKKAKRA
jgi:hypothetical protein